MSRAPTSPPSPFPSFNATNPADLLVAFSNSPGNDDSALSPGTIAGISVASIVICIAAVSICRLKASAAGLPLTSIGDRETKKDRARAAQQRGQGSGGGSGTSSFLASVTAQRRDTIPSPMHGVGVVHTSTRLSFSDSESAM